MMIILDNYNKIMTYIIIDSNGYSIIDAQQNDFKEQGVGGFEKNELFGVFVDNRKLYFIYNEQIFEAKPNSLSCINESYDKENRLFQVKIGGKKVCEILYKPYVSPLVLTFGDDDDEFDFLLYLSRLLKSEESILNFMVGMNKLKTGEYRD